MGALKSIIRLTLLSICIIISSSLYAQTQVGSDIDGKATGDQYGSSVSLSNDGGTVAIGAPWNDDNGTDAGHVRVYKNVNGAWTQIGSDIDGEAGGNLSGISISLSGDGSSLVIGAYHNNGNGTNSGHARVYKNISGTWKQVGTDINGETAGDVSGRSVSLSNDGGTVAIGAPWNDDNGTDAGHVRVYKNVNGAWTQIGSDIDGKVAYDHSGNSLCLSGDGNTVAIGAVYDDNNGNRGGHARVYKNVNGAWTQIGSDIDGETNGDTFGWFVSLSGDGSTCAVGAPKNTGNGTDAGHVRVYKNTNGAWKQIGSDIDGEAANDRSGAGVSLSNDGSIVAIGASGNDGNGNKSGHARVYKNVNGAWTQIGSDIDGKAGDNLGSAISLSNDGSIVAIGAPGNDANGSSSGTLRVFAFCSDNEVTDTIMACDSYTWTNNITYTKSNHSDKDTFVNAAGCLDIVTLNLTIINTDSIILFQPKNQAVSASSTAHFVTVSGNTNSQLQWQSNLGFGFKNLSTAGQYSGVNKDTLTIANVTLSNNNEVFRCIISSNNCSDTTDVAILTVTDNTGVNEYSKSNIFSIYPNPTNSEITIKADVALIGTTYTIYNSNGQSVSYGYIKSTVTTIDFGKFVEGVYLISIGKNLKQTIRVVKK